MPELTRTSHVELTVRDADLSAAWFERVLGMQRLVDDASESVRVINLIHPTARSRSGCSSMCPAMTVSSRSCVSVSITSRATSCHGRGSWVEHPGGCG